MAFVLSYLGKGLLTVSLVSCAVVFGGVICFFVESLSGGGLTGDMRSMGITSTLILNADGTGSIDFPTPEEGNWYTEDGYVRFGENGMPMQF